jgi:hypothetical protein
MRTKHLLVTVLLVVTVALSACGGGAPSGSVQTGPTGLPQPTSPPKVNSITFIANETGLLGADGLPPAWTVVSLQNDDKRPHQLVLIKLADGKTDADLLSALASKSDRLPDWAKYAGGPDLTAPGTTSVVGLVLEPGVYVALSMAVNAEGKADYTLGYHKVINVTGEPNGKMIEPESELVIDMADYEFKLVASIAGGAHTLRVNNSGTEPHEMQLVQLQGAATAADYVKAIAAHAADLPGKPIGGLSAIEPGAHAYVMANLEAGRYALICLQHDASGAVHADKGMTLEFEIAK